MPVAPAALQEEIEQQGRARLAGAWLSGAVVQLAFWVLDVAMVPERRWLFLAIRIVLVGVYALAARIALRAGSSARYRAALQVAMFAMTAVVTTMTFFMGGFGALYSYFVPLSVYSIAVLVPWTVGEGALFLGLSLGYYLAGNGLLLWSGTGTWREALGGAMFVATASVFAFLTIVFTDRGRRAELSLRADLVAANAALAERSAALQAGLAELRERESRLASIGGMTRAIVHDLRNPLAAILSLSQAALEDVRAGGGSEEVAEDLAMVVASSQRLRAMLEEVLAFARGGGAPARAERVEVAGLVAESVAPLVPALRSAGVEVRLDVSRAAGVHVLADRDALRRVLENLVKNAAEAIGLKHVDGGGTRRGQVRVEASEAAADGPVAIRVVDDGCGIPEAVRGSLFEPFATAGKARGTGLGLMMARGVARSHGGDLVAEPPPEGGGAAFCLTLPAAPG